MDYPISLSKYLAHAGVTSRRGAVDIIHGGRVSVNGHIITEPGYKVKKSDVIKMGKKVIKLEAKVYVLFNKPKGYVTTLSDERGRATVMDLLKNASKQRLYPVGRLDKDTTGVLLVTNDGDLSQKLAHPKFGVKKVYHVVLDTFLKPEHIIQLKKGIRLTDGIARVDKISHIIGKKKNHVRVTIHSGKKRIVRRIFERLGYEVKALDRINFAHLTKRGLKVGMWRFLKPQEIEVLKQL